MKKIKVKKITLYERIYKINSLIDLLIKTDICIFPVNELSAGRKDDIKNILNLITVEIEAIHKQIIKGA